jgi:hypothetical protein
MTRDEAESIQLHLIEAAAAISRAEHAIAEAGPDAREALGGHLRDVGKSLHTGLLYTIYQRFPDLKPPPGEDFDIDSELYWDEVLLPAGITEAGLDEIIFSALTPRWQKTAWILVLALKDCEKRTWRLEAEVIAARILALADDDRIDQQGDLRMWRYSEVRLLQQAASVP